CEFPYLNPQTGPFYVEGAEPGDTLAVHFISIEPARDWGASTTVPFFGALTGTHATALLHDPLPELVWMWHLDRSAGTCRFTARKGDFAVDLPLNPMHGTVGVAPANLEVRSALVPDAFGGNMDTPEMRAGVTCYLGVNVAGALFSLRGGHAPHGEGGAPRGRGGDLRGGGGDRDEHRPRPGPDQGQAVRLAAAGVRGAHHVRGLGAPAGGRVPHRPGRPGPVAGHRLRARPAGCLPARHPGRR